MKDLLNLTELNKTEIARILDIASQMRRIVTASYKKGPQLLGSTVGGVWQKSSRLSVAFALATEYLSGTFVSVTTDNAAEQGRCFANMGVNILAVSNVNDNFAGVLGRTLECPVINCGSGRYSPVTVLSMLMALNSKLDGLQNISVLAVGNRDVNVMEELGYCLDLYNSGLIWYLPKDDFATQRRGIVIDKIDVAFTGADAVVDIGLKDFSEPEKYYGTSGGISEKLLDKARINVPLLGARTIVDNTGIKEYPYSAENAFESCMVSVAMAVLYLLHKR